MKLKNKSPVREENFFDKEELPEGWLYKKLGEIVSPSKDKIEPTVNSDYRYIGLEHIESNSTKIIGYGVASELKSTKTIFHAGDVLYGKLRPYLNKVTVPDFDGVCSTDILVFNQNQTIDARYLMRYLSTRKVVEYANLKSKGISLPRVNFESLAEIDVPLPPLAEQQRIIARVEVLLAHVNAAHNRLSRVPFIMKRFRQGVLAIAFSGRLTEEYREEMLSKKISNPEDNSLGGEELPEGWYCKKLGDIAARITKGATPTSYGYKFQSTGIKFVKIENIINDKISVTSIKQFISSEANENQKRSILESGDILFSIAGTIGNVCLVKEEDLPANTNQAIAIIKGTSHVFEPEFLRLFLLSKLALDQVASKARGGAMNNVSLDDIRDIIIPIPPRSEQQLIISSVNVLFEHADAIERGVAVEKKRTEILTQAILGKVFRGELITYETKNC